MSILSSHAGSWYGDKWYRRAWYIWPQVISLLLVGWLFAGALLKPIPWAQPKTQPPPPTKTQPPVPSTPPDRPASSRDDEIICWMQNYSRDALNACTRVIDACKTGMYFHRAQIYFRNGDYYRAIADPSASFR